MNVLLFAAPPTSVWLPVTLYVAPSPSTNPSPVTVTLLFVSGLPSYSFVSVALVSVTLRFVTVSVPYVAVTVSYCPAFVSTYSYVLLFAAVSVTFFTVAAFEIVTLSPVGRVNTSPDSSAVAVSSPYFTVYTGLL